MFGVLGAGLVMDYFNPNWVWYLSGIFSMVAVVGFLGLGKPAAARLKTMEDDSAETPKILAIESTAD